MEWQVVWGVGRCITLCPVNVDLIENLTAIRKINLVKSQSRRHSKKLQMHGKTRKSFGMRRT